MKHRSLMAIAVLLLPCLLMAQNPKLLKDVNPGAASSNPSNFVSLSNGACFFTADGDDADTDKELYYYSDVKGTQKINLRDATHISTTASFITPTRNAANNKVIFVGDNYPGFFEMWITDGTQASTHTLETITPANGGMFQADAIAAFDNEIVYAVRTAANHIELHKINVQTEQTSLVKDFGIPAGINANSSILSNFTVVGNTLYFNYYKADGSDELWKTDGTTTGTLLVKNLGFGGMHTYFMPLTNGSRIVFMVYDAANNTNDSLWVSDGTPAGTNPVKRFARSATVGNVYPAYGEDGTGNGLFVSFEDTANGKQVWKTDGTAVGTTLRTLFNTPAGCDPKGYYLDNGTMYFTCTFAGYGRELFKTPTVGGSFFLVKDFNAGAGDGNPEILGRMPGYVNGDLLIVSANDGTYGQELYAVDANNTADKILINDIAQGITGAFPVTDDKRRTSQPFAYNNIYFSAYSPEGGREVYRLDGFGVAWKKTGATGQYYDAANWAGDNGAISYRPGILVPYRINALAPATINLANAAGGNGAWGFWINAGTVEVPANFLIVGELGIYNTTITNLGGSFNLADNGQGFPNKIYCNGFCTVPIQLTYPHQLASDFRISSTLTLSNNSYLFLNDYFLDAFGNVIADSANYVVTNGKGTMWHYLGAGTTNSYKFHIGPATGSYNPITITNTGTADYFTVRVAPNVQQAGTAGGNVAANVVNRTWHISENVAGGSVASLTFQWDTLHETLGFNRAVAQGAHYTGASWAFDAMSNITNTSAHITSTLNNVTSFSPFTLTSNPALLQTWTSGTGPGGVSNTTGTDNLKIWLKADADAFADNGNSLAATAQGIQQWNDKSGSGNNAKLTSSGSPLFTASGLNGMPALSFTGSQSLDINYNISPAVTPRMSVFTVSTHNTMVTSPLSKLWGHEDGGYDRGGIGPDWRTTTNMGYHNGNNAINFFNAVKDTTYIISALYTPTLFNGYARGTRYVNNAAVAHGSGKPTLTIGNNSTSATSPVYTDFWNGKIAEFILYDDTLNKAKRIVVENYLGAKYGARLETNDIYTMDDVANGNFDYDVAGIGKADDGTATATGAQGSNLVRMQTQVSPFIFGADNFLFWGHNNKPLTVIADTSIPEGVACRMQRVWRVNERGDVGPCRIYMTVQNMGPYTPANFCMLIDKNNNGSFSDETVAGGGIITGANAFNPFLYFDFPDLANGQRFTFGSTTPLTYTFNGSGNFTDAANWLDSNIPPSEIDGGIEVIINPATGGQCILNVPFYIKPGAKLTVRNGKQFVVKGNLMQE